jgi:hypothetical protein
LDSGEVWSTKEATDLFFGITKLFQHNDVPLSFPNIILMNRLLYDKWYMLSSKTFQVLQKIPS